MWGSRFRRTPVLHIAGDSGTGPVVVMVHGIASSSSATFQNLVPLLEPSFRCILIDLLGFGESPAPDDAEYTLEEHVAALAATIATLKLTEPFVLVGHSLGALIAARYAARFRKQVRRPRAREPAGVPLADRVRRPPRSSPAGLLPARLRVPARQQGLHCAQRRDRRADPADPPGDPDHAEELDAVRAVAPELHRVADHDQRPRRGPGADRRRLRQPRRVRVAGRDAHRRAARRVTMHRVWASSHLIRRRLAREVARVVVAAVSPVR